MSQLLGFPQYPSEELDPKLYNALMTIHTAIRNLDTTYGLITGADEYSSAEWAAVGIGGALTHGRYTRSFVTAGESITAGHLINLYDTGTELRARKAIASGISTVAHGIATSSATAGVVMSFNWLRCYTTLIGSLSRGTLYYLSPSSAGIITNVKPTTSGQVVQPVGVAASTTGLLLDIPLSYSVVP